MKKAYNGRLFLPTIGCFLKEKREKSGLSQKEVSEATNIARSNIPKYEKGDIDFPVSRIPELCHLYKCRMSDCGTRVDNEMGFYTIATKATESKFMEYQYMSFAAGTPMVSSDEEIVDEQEFRQLIQAVIRFKSWELQEILLPPKEMERLLKNFSFFMVEFIIANEPNCERKERLLNLCNNALKEEIHK